MRPNTNKEVYISPNLMQNPITTPPLPTKSEEGEKPSILYIDNEEDNVVVFKSTFRKYFKVFTAMSGDEGLRILNSEDIAVVITDHRMPKMTGVQLLKNLPENTDVTRIIMTAHTDVESVLEAINYGKVYKYILKPWDKEVLKSIIENGVERFKNQRASRSLVQELTTAKQSLEQEVALLKQAVQLLQEKDAKVYLYASGS